MAQGIFDETDETRNENAEHAGDREAFLDRFKRRLLELLGDHYDAKYVDEIAPTYWDDIAQREEGPEECAEAEASEWGEE